MNIYMLILRTVHIFGGALWVGSAIVYLFFIVPTIKSIGTGGQAFLQHFIGRQRYPLFMNTVALLTILSGALLIFNVSGGALTGWIRTGPGLGFAIGSVVGIAVYFLGFFMIRPRADRLGGLSREIGKSGGPPTPAQAAELHSLDQQLLQIERLDFILLTIALFTMATARYWRF